MNVIGVTRDHWNHNYLVRPIGHIHSHCSFCLCVAQLTITCTKYGQLIIWTIIKRYWQQMSAFNVKDTKFHIRPRPGRGELTELQCFLQTALLDFRGPTSILVPATINFEITFDLIVCTRTSVAIEHVPDWRWERGTPIFLDILAQNWFVHMGNTMSSSFYMILDMLVAMADLGYGGPWLWWPLAMAGRFRPILRG